MTLFDRLQESTSDAHRRLEDELDLLRSPPSRTRFTAVLQRFLGFHTVWEPAVARCGLPADLLAGRSRLDQVRTDLCALGLSAAQIAAVPGCEAAASLVPSAAAALGSMYVIEGSSLGGKVISRALAQASWLPVGGLRYFDPYGADAGLMWRSFRRCAVEICSEPDWPDATAAAVAAFDLLRRWLGTDLPA